MKIFYCLLTLTLFTASSVFSQTEPCWEEVWSDEFNVDGLPDSTKWGYDLGGGGWGNNELQTYTKDLKNAKVENGKLIITAIKENNNWTSARLISKGKGDWKYGRIEVKAKLPAAAKGTWSAIWMLPTDWEYGGWPKSGEIDIMENVGYDPNTIVGTVHTDAYNHGKGTQRGNTTVVNDNASAFHVYAIEWYQDSITFFVDDKQYHIFENEYETYAEWPFDKRQHLLLNIAMGGNWGGLQGIDANLTSATMEIEYVKVFQNESSMAIDGEKSAIKSQAGLTFRAPYSKDFTYSWEVPADATILGSSTDSVVTVNWGCSEGTVICHITGTCGVIDLEHNVTLKEAEITGSKFAAPNETGLTYAIDSLANTTYTWTVPEGATITSGGGTNKITVTWNNATGSVSLDISNNCVDTKVSFQTYLAGQYPYPDLDSPHAIPGEIEATDYDYGGEGIAYHDTDNKNEGQGLRGDEAVDTEFGDASKTNVGWINNGEWLEYTVTVAESNWYEAKIRAGSAGAPDSMSISFNDEVKFGPVKIKGTGSWSIFVAQSVGKAYLEAGEYVMRYKFFKGGYNVGKIAFTVTTAPPAPEPEPEPEPEEPNGIEDEIFAHVKLYPNPSSGDLLLSGIQNISKVVLVDIVGRTQEVAFTREKVHLYSVKINSIPKGVYTIQAFAGNGILKRRISLK
ncbi:MAG TPA: family 16 glycosylhydrolase [Cytophagales bacterium]|nr:family 16 glycosylhydrolase [Cytophagales bacterium]